MEESRPSFSKEKVGTFKKGPTGITSTSKNMSTPTAEISEFDENGNYSASDVLYRNIDAIGKSFINQVENEEQINEIDDWSNSILEEISEDEIIKDLDKHLGINPGVGLERSNNSQKFIVKDIFCRNCGLKYIKDDNFCASCGNKRKTS